MATASPHKSGGTQLVGTVVEGERLYAAGLDNSFWRRSIGSRAAEWEKIGQAVDVVALAGFSGQIFALDSSSVIWRWNL